VVRTRDFGYFVKVAGFVEGLLPRTKVDGPLQVGSAVRVRVHDVTGEGKWSGTAIFQGGGGAPGAAETQTRGAKKARGVVTRVVRYGAFLRTADGREGLLHLKQTPQHVVLRRGDRLEVRVVAIQPNGKCEFSYLRHDYDYDNDAESRQKRDRPLPKRESNFDKRFKEPTPPLPLRGQQRPPREGKRDDDHHQQGPSSSKKHVVIDLHPKKTPRGTQRGRVTSKVVTKGEAPSKQPPDQQPPPAKRAPAAAKNQDPQKKPAKPLHSELHAKPTKRPREAFDVKSYDQIMKEKKHKQMQEA